MRQNRSEFSGIGIAAALIFLSLSSSHSAIASEVDNVKGSIPTKGLKKQEYTKLAKITEKAAASAALANHPGKVLSTKLENENGFLIYAVEILSKEGSKSEVLVDAGTGKTLSIADQDDDESDD